MFGLMLGVCELGVVNLWDKASFLHMLHLFPDLYFNISFDL